MLLFCAETSHAHEQVSTRTGLPPREFPWESSLWETFIFRNGVSALQLQVKSHCLVLQGLQVERAALLWQWDSSPFSVSLASREFIRLWHKHPAHDPSGMSTPKFVCGTHQQQCSSPGTYCQAPDNQLHKEAQEAQRSSLQFYPYFEPKENENLFSLWDLRHKCLYVFSIAHVNQKMWV